MKITLNSGRAWPEFTVALIELLVRVLDYKDFHHPPLLAQLGAIPLSKKGELHWFLNKLPPPRPRNENTNFIRV